MMSEETKAKIGNSNRGRVRSIEVKEKMSSAMKNKLWWNNGTSSVKSEQQPSAEFVRGRVYHTRDNKRGADSLNHKSVKINDIVFDTMSDAAKHFGKSNATITYWIKTGKAYFITPNGEPQHKGF